MRQWIKQTLLILLVVFSAQLVAAETIGERYRVGQSADQGSLVGKITKAFVGGKPYEASSNNLSRTYLSSMFGSVQGALYGETNNLVSMLFRVFNLGVISIATLLIIYSSVFSVSTTSQDGGALGSGRFSPWALVRVVVSWGSLVPAFGGYSLVQLVAMKVIVAGTMVADTAWEAAVDLTSSTPEGSEEQKLSSGTHLLVEDWEDGVAQNELKDTYAYSIESIEGYLNPINMAIIDSIRLIKKCSTVLEGGYVGSTVTPRFIIQQSVDAASNTEKMAVSLYLTADGKSVEIPCFDLLWRHKGTMVPTKESLIIKASLLNYIRMVSSKLLDLHMEPETVNIRSDPKAMQRFASGLNGFYQRVRNNGFDNLVISESKEGDFYKRQGWVAAGMNYHDIQRAPEAQDIDPFINFGNATVSLVNYGYALLGQTLKPAELRDESYFAIKGEDDAKENGTRAKVLDMYKVLYERVPPKTGASENLMSFLKSVYLEDENSLLNGVKGWKLKGVDRVTKKFHMGPITIRTSKVSDKIRDMSESVIHDTLEKMLDLSDQGYKGSPVADLEDLGKKVLTHSITFFRESTRALYIEVTRAQHAAYGIFSGIAIVKGVLKGLVAYYQAKGQLDEEISDLGKKVDMNAKLGLKGFDLISDPVEHVIEFAQAVAKSIVGVYLPLGNGLAVAYFVAGLVLAAYVPFMPKLIYIFAVMAWMFAVIEAMIAAPIVMIGFAHPEGHEMLGKAEQAVMLLTGVFLRPILTVIGFLLAVLLSSELIKLFSFIFAISLLFFVKNVMAINHPISLTFAVAGIVLLYSYALVIVLQQCYSMIYVIPDQILKWVGGPAESAGAGIASAMRSMSTGLTQQSQSAAMGAGQASGGGTRITTRQV